MAGVISMWFLEPENCSRCSCGTGCRRSCPKWISRVPRIAISRENSAAVVVVGGTEVKEGENKITWPTQLESCYSCGHLFILLAARRGFYLLWPFFSQLNCTKMFNVDEY